MQQKKRFRRNMDRRETFQANVKPIVDNLERTCYREKIPMFASFAVRDNTKETEYESVMISPATLNHKLTDDRLSDFIRVIQGYRTIAPGDDAAFEFDENIAEEISDDST